MAEEGLKHVEDDEVGGELEAELGQAPRHRPAQLELVPAAKTRQVNDHSSDSTVLNKKK